MNWQPQRLVGIAPVWSLTAALTPGGHHVRLYLETEGKITTLLSKLDNFVEFFQPGGCGTGSANAAQEGGATGTQCSGEIPRSCQPGGCGTGSANTAQDGGAPKTQCIPPQTLATVPLSALSTPGSALKAVPGNSPDCSTDLAPISFFDLSGSRVHDLRPRDPNVTVSDLGVYSMTWDNRSPIIGPGSPGDETALSYTFGLAFSVDGLNWTVVSNALKIGGLGPNKASLREEDRPCSQPRPTGGIRHVVPVFLTNDQIRLYFSYQTELHEIGRCGGEQIACSLGTAISN